MRKFLFFIGIVVLGSTQAQFLEFGAGIGGFNYSGDLIRGYQLTNVKPGVTIHHRLNFTEFLSVRWELGYGTLSGSDDKPIDALARERDYKFRINVAELSSTIEYHFLDYRHEKSIVRWSPYAFAGIAFLRMINTEPKNGDYNKLQPSLPFGVGFKHLIGKRFSAGVEFGGRLTFFDYLDNVSEDPEYPDLSVKDPRNQPYGNPNDNDWYYYFCISFSYIIWDIPCPFPYVPNKSILRR